MANAPLEAGGWYKWTCRFDTFYFKYIYTVWPVQLYTVVPQGPVKTWEYTKMHAHIVHNKKHINNLTCQVYNIKQMKQVNA